MTNEVEEILRSKLTPEEFEFAQEILELSPARIRELLENKMRAIEENADQ